ncbi:sensor histidine kinase [Streptomyces tsukubensis]|uniref:sensor histidine kinase n=2 Tax=Streptomyces TaxID=1883 RepID=UPI00025CDC70|nr:HAMP domain-containing sensor histidine kinase [Streptomyces tsukubensis]EIF87999.1 signal transduction histidine kinase-like protein [Streptomyces tsukubensis NRRL18488]
MKRVRPGARSGRPVRFGRRALAPLRGSVRARMTLLYGGVFTVITLAVLITALRLQKGIVDGKVDRFVKPGSVAGIPCEMRPPESPCSAVPYRPSADTAPAASPPGPHTVLDREGKAQLQHDLASTQLVVSLIAIGVIMVLAFVVCWWLTGRLLRPLQRVTTTARRLSLSTLHERIALTGPRDELKDLADTFDAMLDRLEHAVASQRRFVANASHELRTPLAIQRTAMEVGLADPSPERVARIREELLRATERSERLIEGLLVLAQGEQELTVRAPVDLATVVDQVIGEHLPFAERRGIAVGATTRPVTVAGDEVLITRLVANLVQNAIRHNDEGGRLLVDLSPAGGLVVSNTGPEVPPEQVGELFEPFRRLHADRTGSSEGAGLGLSIVAAIAQAHGGTVRAAANPGGGLAVTVALPVLVPSG